MLSAQYKRYFYILCSTSNILIGWIGACVFGPRSGFVLVSTPDGQILASKAFTLTIMGSRTTKLIDRGNCFVPYFSLWREYLCLPTSDYYEQHIKSEGQWAVKIKKTVTGCMNCLVLKVSQLIWLLKTGLKFLKSVT